MNDDRCILLVEDDSNDIFFFDWALKKAGIPATLQVVSDGESALDYLRGKGIFADRSVYPAPWLTVLDLNLPGLRGTEVLRAIRDDPGIAGARVIVLTSSLSERDRWNAGQAGAAKFMVKPGSLEKLVEFLKTLDDGETHV